MGLCPPSDLRVKPCLCFYHQAMERMWPLGRHLVPRAGISQQGCQLPPIPPLPSPPGQGPERHGWPPFPVVINNWVLVERRLLIPAQAAPGRGNLWKHWRPW